MSYRGISIRIDLKSTPHVAISQLLDVAMGSILRPKLASIRSSDGREFTNDFVGFTRNHRVLQPFDWEYGKELAPWEEAENASFTQCNSPDCTQVMRQKLGRLHETDWCVEIRGDVQTHFRRNELNQNGWFYRQMWELGPCPLMEVSATSAPHDGTINDILLISHSDIWFHPTTGSNKIIDDECADKNLDHLVRWIRAFVIQRDDVEGVECSAHFGSRFGNQAERLVSAFKQIPKCECADGLSFR